MLLGGNPDPAAKAKALELLMRQKQLGMLGLGSGDRVLAPLGKQMIGDVQQQQEMQAQSAQRAAQQAFQQQQLQRQQASDAETARYHQGMLNIDRQRLQQGRESPALTIVTGEGGAQYLVDPRKPDRPASPILGPDGKPIAKPKAVRALQTHDKVILDDLTGELNALADLSSRFESSFAGGGPLGGLATSAYQVLGSAGTEGMQKDAAFWSDFSRLVDLPQRNRMFGASLTATEKQSWEGAKNIRPGTSPSLVKAKLAEMQSILENKLSNISSSLAAEGYNTEAITRRTSRTLGQGDAEAKAWAEANPDDPRSAAILEKLKAKGL
jgi:hypothetical protein